LGNFADHHFKTFLTNSLVFTHQMQGNEKLTWMKVPEYFETISHNIRVTKNLNETKLAVLPKRENIDCIGCIHQGFEKINFIFPAIIFL